MKYILFLLSIFILISCDSNNFIQNDNSKNTKEIEVYFSQNRYPYENGIDEKIIDSINNAQESIYLAIYELTNKKISKALINAYNKNIKVIIITDDQTYLHSDELKKLEEEGIEVYKDLSKSSLMHNKFLIIDNETIWTGSGNYTYYAFYRNYENFLKIRDKQLAKAYYDEFLELINNEKIPKCSNDFNITLCFSPEDKIESKIVNLINEANSSINVAMFSFTSEKISTALIDAKNRNVNVKVILDKGWSEQNSRYSQYSNLKNNNIAIKLDGSSYKLHDKFLVIDSKIVATGSFNYTKKANTSNRENELFIYKKNISLKYNQEFFKIWKEAL